MAHTSETPADTEHMALEIASQPEMWARAAGMAVEHGMLPAAGANVAVVGCGTSWFMAQSYASLREASGHGRTDAFAASEASLDRDYDAIIAITRSGTTTEVLDLLQRNGGRIPTIGIVADTASPFVDLVDQVIALPFADESSVVQTRFATTALALLRTSLGADLSGAIADAANAVAAEPDPTMVAAQQFTFLGRGWAVGLANEAALKLREAAQAWTESYPAMEYRHGPIAIAAPNRVTWMLGPTPSGLRADVQATGAHFVHSNRDPMAELISIQKVALQRARSLGLDVDQPRSLTRSVVLR